MPKDNKDQANPQPPKDAMYRAFTPGSYTEEKDDKGNVTQRKVRATFVSEDPVEVYDWNEGDRIREVLRMDGMKLPANKQVPLLDNHSRWEGSSSVRGSCRNMQDMSNGTGETDVYFSSLANDVATLAREGHLTDLSVGYKTDPKATTWIEPGQRGTCNGRDYDNTGSTCRMAIRTTWYPFEISTTPIGADARAKFREAAMDIPKPTQRSEQMPTDKQPDNAATPASASVDQDKIRVAALKEGQEAERARSSEIETAGREMKVPEEFYRKLITDGTPAAEATRKMIVEAQRLLKTVPVQSPDVGVGADETDKFRDAASTGLLLRTGYPTAKLDPAKVKLAESSEFRGSSMQTLARYCLERAGTKGVWQWTNDQVAKEILNASRASTAQATGDFTYITAAAANKFLMKGHEEAQTTYQMWVGRQPLNDFKQNKLINLSGFSDIDLIPEGENPKWGKFADRGEYITLVKYGKAFVLSMEAIVNDDKNAFSRIPEAIGGAVARKKNRTVYHYLYYGNTEGAESAFRRPDDERNKRGDVHDHIRQPVQFVSGAVKHIACRCQKTPAQDQTPGARCNKQDHVHERPDQIRHQRMHV